MIGAREFMRVSPIQNRVFGKTMVKHQLFVGCKMGGFCAVFGHAWMERIVSEWIA